MKTVATENRFIIDCMIWSFTRLECFYQCKAAWKKKYIECEGGAENAYSQYGGMAHKIFERYLKGEITIFEMAEEYKKGFGECITEPFPYNKSADLAESYYNKGLKYFEEFTEIFPGIKDILGVEKKIEFEIGGYPFIGYIDLLATNANGKLIVCDHKSASAKFKKNGKPTKDLEKKLVMYKRQLYLYCKALIEEGLHPEILCWNFFNEQKVYSIPFDWDEYKEAVDWALDTIHLIENETEFEENPDYYYCKNICDGRFECRYGVQEEKEDDAEMASDFNAWQSERQDIEWEV